MLAFLAALAVLTFLPLAVLTVLAWLASRCALADALRRRDVRWAMLRRQQARLARRSYVGRRL